MTKVTNCLWCGSKDIAFFCRRHKDGTPIVECKKCGLLMLQEWPENLDEVYYNEEYFNPSSSDIDTGYHETYELIPPAFLFWQNSFVEELNEGHKPKHFFEIGTATGNLLEMLRDNQPNLTLSGIDLSEYAAGAARQRGLDVQAAYIEKYTATPKQDIIFSSETMEHLENLKSFLEGVANNLAPDGTFLFYVPSISLADAKKERDTYLRFNVNLEHLLHFTPEFMDKAMSDFFHADTYIKEFRTDDGPFLVGAVSKDRSNLVNLKTFFEALDSEKIPAKATPIMLKNLTIVALKFGKFDFAEETFEKLKKTGEISTKDMLMLEGIRGFHKGELEKSSIAFEKLLQASSGSLFATRALLANERLTTRANRQRIVQQQEEINRLTASLQKTEGELKDIHLSRLIKPAIKLRDARRKSTNWTRWTAARAKNKTMHMAKKVLPASVRRPLGKLIRREWQVKHTTVTNHELATGKPLVSVVIPYYNRLATIGETLASLQAQTFRNFEVIIVDDDSTKAQAISKVDKRFMEGLKTQIISHQKNKGVAAARNTGIAKAKGKYVMCLDSDDFIEPTYIEKFATVFESDPSIGVVSSDMRHFGVNNYVYKEGVYDARRLLENNMLTSASMFTKQGWEATGGFKSNLGYEDWEFWINLAEHGYFGRNIAEPLLNYRSAASSRYIDDQAKHAENIARIRDLHPGFVRKVKAMLQRKRFDRMHITADSLFTNLDDPADFNSPQDNNPKVLITVPWMTFGGAETLIYNFCREIKDEFHISFVTGLPSEHEWEYKFREISPHIYHLANLFDVGDKTSYLEFVSNYIKSRNVDILHIIHNGFTFDMLAELKKRHPRLKIALTMFNSRVEYFQQSISYQEYIDIFTTDNEAVAEEYRSLLEPGAKVTVIPNGIDCYNEFSPLRFNRYKERQALDLDEKDLAVFFVGRLSVEKNPNVFLAAAKQLLRQDPDGKFRFFVVGDGPMRPEIDQIIASIGSDRVQYLGYKTAQEVARCLSAADVFVLPSAIEGFPLSILEAMAMSVVTVASNVGAVGDVITDGKEGFVVAPGSAEEIIDRLQALESDPKKLEEMKVQARETMTQKYSSRILGKNYVQLYRQTLGKL